MAKLNESEAFALMIEHLRNAEECSRALGVMRLDRRWIAVASHLVEMQNKLIALAKEKLQSRII